MSGKVLAREGRVTVRKFRRSDLQDRLEWPPYTDALFTHLNCDLSNFIEREKWIFARIMNSGRMYFAIEDEHGEFIGEISLRDIDADAKMGRLGIHLASNKLGRAYGREALSALLSYYFLTMKWNAVFLDVAAYNHRALRLYERLNFQYLPPFWRRIVADESVLTDPACAGIRQLLRRGPSGIEGFHHDMSLTRERYLQAREASAAVETSPPIHERQP